MKAVLSQFKNMFIKIGTTIRRTLIENFFTLRHQLKSLNSNLFDFILESFLPAPSLTLPFPS